jgi:hypothetical protein
VFVELKWESNNPVYAAFEVLSYGVIYLFSRKFLSRHYGTREWMKKSAILLSVLAPAPFYENCLHAGLRNFENSLDSAIRSLVHRHFGHDLKMGFCFARFPEDFKWPWESENIKGAVRQVESLLRTKLDGVSK